MKKVAIIGAGISGLSMARFLQDRFEVKVFEKEQTPGGLVRCQRVNGSLFHLCGGHVFNSKLTNVLNWFWNIFDKEKQFSKADRNSVVIMDSGEYIPYPIENHMYLFDNNLQRGFISDLLKIARKESDAPTNFEDFLRGRFGDTLYDAYFCPYNEKVWRRSLKDVPLSWLEGKLPMPTVEEMIYNNMNHTKEKEFVHSSFWYEKVGGSQFLADTLSSGLDIKYGEDIESVIYDRTSRQWTISGETFDKVVFCGNIKDMVKMISGADLDKFRPDVEALDYHGTTAVFCEIDANPYSWIYLPSRAYQSHRIICTGNFSETNNGKELSDGRITATIEFTDEISKDDIMDNLKRIPLRPKYLTHVYHKYTYPIQKNDTREMILNLKKTLEPLDFYFTGRFADWEYYNMDAAMGAAMNLSAKIES